MRAEFYRGWASLCALMAPIVLCPLSALGPQETAAVSSPQRPVQFRNAEAGVAYVGSKACAECHSDIYASYLKTDMGRAMSLPGEWKDRDELSAPVKVKHPKSHRSYEVYRRGADLYESEYELDAEGKEVFRDDQKISYIVGSGANGFSCIVHRGDFLFEAPLSYYSKAKAWGLSPGYDQGDYGFNRPIQARCIACHSGRPQSVQASEGRFKDPPFLELSIGCESCHGPGALHVEERKKAAPLDGELDRSIVNPAKLPTWLANNVCMYCHEGADARALMPGKSYVDFRPGTPLADTLRIFAVPFDRGAPPQDPMLQHFVLMSLSQCYLRSGGKLACITCHDPHRQPSPEEAAPLFRSKCLTCHMEKSCGLPLEVRAAKTPPDDCAGCHMPKQPLKEISHSSLTDHRILARPGEPLPESAFHLTTTQLPDLVQLDSVPRPLGTPVPPLTLFRAYGELLAAHPDYLARFDSVLDSLAAAKTEDAVVLAALARRKMREASAESQAAAADFLQRAVRAGSTDADDFEQLATIQAEAGRTQDAIATVRRGTELNAYSPRLYRLLAALYVSVRAYDDALSTMRKDLELFPEDSFIRSLVPATETAKAQAGNRPKDPP
jgi:hypothetical protein